MKTLAWVRSVLLFGGVTLAASTCVSSATPPPAPPPPPPGPSHSHPPDGTSWDDMTAAAATGYCLAVHPYRTIHRGAFVSPVHPRGFTPDGYEIVPLPGIVGAVRRNYVRVRSTRATDQGVRNTCEQACRNLAGPGRTGTPLHQKVAGGPGSLPAGFMVSGIGDMAAMAVPDLDVDFGKDVIAGILSTANNWNTADVAKADFCCCYIQ